MRSRNLDKKETEHVRQRLWTFSSNDLKLAQMTSGQIHDTHSGQTFAGGGGGCNIYLFYDSEEYIINY